MYVLRHKATGEFYSGMTLGYDVRTLSATAARQWSTAAAAAKYGTRFGTRYEVVPA